MRVLSALSPAASARNSVRSINAAAGVGDLNEQDVTKIDKLSILGVRSFDNTRSETIQFHTPLTLIVGYNGSGKTTIIECLKYATTGDLPPNSKGGAFIHDPKLCGEKEVLAQVKMSFKGTSGARMVVTRSLQLTVKKTARQQKTLEGQLLMIKDGERTAISSRVAELDQIMPQYLGVSKAILDSVIFCHQDESLWPMSEPSVLKKKFDEIFEALKYTKAIDNIKQLRKKQNDELTKFKIMEHHSKDDKDKGDRAERKSKELDAELTELRAEIADLHTKTKEADENSRDAWNQEAHYKHEVNQLNLKREKKDWHEKNVLDLSHGLKERNESDELLQAEVDQYEGRMAVHKQHEQQQTKQWDNLRQSIDKSREELRKKHGEAGKYEEQRANHERQIETRKIMINDTSRRHNIRGYDTDLDDMQIKEYTDRISKMSKEQSAAVEKVRRGTEREMKKAQDVLGKLGERKSALNEGRASAKQQSAANDRKIGSCQADLNNMDIDEGGKAILEDKVEDLEVRLRKAKEDSKKVSWDSKIHESNIQLRGLEEENAQLDSDLVQGTKQAGDLARLDHLKKEVAGRRRNLDKMRGAHNDRLKTVMGQDWHASSLEAEFQKVVDRKTQHMKEAERQRDAVSRELEQVDFKLNSARTDLKKGEKELAACVKRLNDSIDGEPEDYSTTLSEIQKDRDILKADVNNFDNERRYFQDGISLAETDHKCKLCLRSFQGGERKEFISSLRAKIEKRTQAGMKEELNAFENDLRRAKDAGPTYDTWVRLFKKELPRLQADVKKLGADRDKILQEIEEHDKTVNDREQAKRDVESLAKPVANIVKYNQDLADFSDQIQELTAKQKDTGMSRTLEDIQEELEVIRGKSRFMRDSINKITVDKERARSQISTLELDLSKAKNDLSTANHQLDKKGDIFKQIEELRSVNREHRDTVRRLDVQLQELAPQIAEEETKIDDVKQRGTDNEKSLQQEASRLSDSVHKLNLAEQNIRSYIEDGGPGKIARCQREIESGQQEIRRTEDEQKQVTISINKIREELRNHDETKRTILDNLKYRRSLRELETLKTEIANLSAQNAEADRNYWNKEASRWQRKLSDFTTQKTSKLGAAKAKDDQLAELIQDWQTDYKDAAYKFKKAHIEVETTKAAVEDLGRYGGALDKAIMKYHGIKMEEINRIIEELWKKTYQGTDVDTILIRSDNEAAKGNRSYNYRVCMVKQDAEMDMRGRCSAGQKVLASIIIRLALAECFGVNCGLIALDEPTTNLDRDNIRSLASSLHDIIEARQHQSNFQLIVITHDEEFLKFMKCPDFCDNYYRVSRNDRQKSIIERQSIAEVM